MKKNKYLSYLSEYHGKMPNEVSRCLKTTARHSKSNRYKPRVPNIERLNSETSNSRPSHSNKENQHPNISQNPQTKAFQNEQSKKLIKQLNSPFAMVESQKQITISLNNCGFEPSHPNECLFLVQSGTNRQMIVCHLCAEKFDQKVPLTKLIPDKTKRAYNEELQSNLAHLNSVNLKLEQLLDLDRDSLRKNLCELQSYFRSFIEKINEMKEESEVKLLETHQKNVETICSQIEKNRQQIGRLQVCQKGHKEGIEKERVLLDIESSKNFKEVTLKIAKLQIPPQSVITDMQSKVCQILNLAVLDADTDLSPENQIQTCSCNQSQDQESERRNFPTAELTVQNLQSKKNSEELLIGSSDSDYMNLSSSPQQKKQNQNDKQDFEHLGEHDQEEPSIDLFLESKANHQKSTNSQSCSNFIKQLHKEVHLPEDNSCNSNLSNEQITHSDLLTCDEELNYSSYHPIHRQTRERKYQNGKRHHSKLESTERLTVSQLSGDSDQDKQTCPRPSLPFLNKPQKEEPTHQDILRELQSNISVITNPSYITNRNDQEISFELDEGLLVDNVLSLGDDIEGNASQSLNIISPAFKAI